jgi:hypothetical protein
MKNYTHKIGAVLYVVWGILHLKAALLVYQLGSTMEANLVQGRLFQSSWNLVFFAVAAIVIAIWFNWKNRLMGYWLNLIMVSTVDIGFIIAVLLPGYIPVFPGILGPVFWVLALIFSTIGILHNEE